MGYSVLAVAATFAAWVVPAHVATRAAEPAPIDLAPRDGVLLLYNGEIIQGKITRAGDYYHVVVPNGEIRMKASDVEARCDSLEDGYRFKRSNIRLGTAQEHLQLGQWCERHRMLDHAEQELAQALAIQPNHPLADLLRRRIDIARRPAQAPAPAPNAAPGAVSPDDLDRLVRGLPASVVESFSQSVQPVLLNNCTAAGCHGPQAANRFSLLKAPAGQPPGRRLTQRNLYAALEWIDPKDPAKSRLVTAPLAPHGTAKAPVFGRNQADQYQRLFRWSYQAAGAADAAMPRDIQPASWEQTKGDVRPAVALEETPQGAFQIGPCPFDESPAEPVQEERRMSDPERGRFEPPRRTPARHGDPTQGFKPADPFDPEIFNRRHAEAQK